MDLQELKILLEEFRALSAETEWLEFLRLVGILKKPAGICRRLL